MRTLAAGVRVSRRTAALVCALLIAGCEPAFAMTYTLTDLGTLGGLWSTGEGINSAGAVTGTSQSSGPLSYAFVYNGSGPMMAISASGWACSTGRGINDAGQVAGAFCTASNSGNQFGPSYAYLYNGALLDLGSLAAAQTPCLLGIFSQGQSINKAGQIAGITCTNTIGPGGQPEVHAFLCGNGGPMQDLGTLGGSFSSALGVNSLGWVTGFADVGSSTSPQVWHAFLYGNAGPMQDIGTLGGVGSIGRSINDAGQVTGEADTGNGTTTHAFLYAAGSAMQDLGTLSPDANFSDGASINGAGQIVGYSDTPLDTRGHGFLYTGGTMLDLNALIDPRSNLLPYVTLTTGDAINSSGWIAADGYDSRTGNLHAYLLAQPSGPPPCQATKFFVCKPNPVFVPCSSSHINLCVVACAFPGCGGTLVNWGTPVIVRGDPWLNGVSLNTRAATPEQARGLAAGLDVTISTEAQSRSVSERTTSALLTERGTSKLVRALVVGPLVDVGAAAPAAAPGRSSASSRAVAILSLPYDATGLAADTSFRMVSFDKRKGRWLEVGAASVGAARHIIQASVSPAGRFTIVAVMPEAPRESKP